MGMSLRFCAKRSISVEGISRVSLSSDPNGKLSSTKVGVAEDELEPEAFSVPSANAWAFLSLTSVSPYNY